ncbi:MAG: primosomal protein N' (replication factor Y) - superfamily II helicase [Gammaproteobacteria bacterium]|nr:primosomal protein N' (replication factor Y) - superfamily II helicase [Gammaproteobacteria bacterium]
MQFACEQCGSQLTFSPQDAALLCANCGCRHHIEHRLGLIQEHDFFAALESRTQVESLNSTSATSCSSCGAKFELGPNIHADVCPFCDSPVVLDPAQVRQLPVNGVLPFEISARRSKDAFKKWLKGLWFAPTRLKEFAREDSELAGMYVPHWTYDCVARCRYEGERGDVYMVPVQVQVRENGRLVTRQRMVPKIRWSPAAGQVTVPFDDVLVMGSESIPRDLARDAAPWDLNVLAPYQPEFLSGFRSELYSIDLEQGFQIARQQMSPTLRTAVRQDIGGDHQRIHSLTTHHSHVRFKHLLLPFWVAAFRFGKRSYRFVVNGRTGEVQGQRPYSVWKIAGAIVAGLIVLGAVVYFATPPHPDASTTWPTQPSERMFRR